MKRTLMVIALALILVSGASSQRLVSTNARPKNTHALMDHIGQYNTAANKFNAEFNAYKQCWDIEPSKLLPHLQEMRKQLDEVESRLLHLDEEQ